MSGELINPSVVWWTAGTHGTDNVSVQLNLQTWTYTSTCPPSSAARNPIMHDDTWAQHCSCPEVNTHKHKKLKSMCPPLLPKAKYLHNAWSSTGSEQVVGHWILPLGFSYNTDTRFPVFPWKAEVYCSIPGYYSSPGVIHHSVTINTLWIFSITQYLLNSVNTSLCWEVFI